MVNRYPVHNNKFFHRVIVANCLLVQTGKSGGTDLPSFEPVFAVISPKIEKLRAMYKTNPRRFEVPKPKSDRGKDEVEYSA